MRFTPSVFKLTPTAFVRRIITDSRKNQGFLLASAVEYNTLLSIVPLFVVLLVASSSTLTGRTKQRAVARAGGGRP